MGRSPREMVTTPSPVLVDLCFLCLFFPTGTCDSTYQGSSPSLGVQSFLEVCHIGLANYQVADLGLQPQ